MAWPVPNLKDIDITSLIVAWVLFMLRVQFCRVTFVSMRYFNFNVSILSRAVINSLITLKLRSYYVLFNVIYSY